MNKAKLNRDAQYMKRLNRRLDAFWVLMLFVCGLLTSCKTQQPVVQTVEVTRTVSEVIRDTAIIIEPDSAAIYALFECDSLNNVVLKQIDSIQAGQRIKPALSVSQAGGSMVAQFVCKEDSLQRELQLRDKMIKELQKQIIIETQKEVPDYYKNTSKGFWILLAIMIVAIGIRVLKLYFRLNGL